MPCPPPNCPRADALTWLEAQFNPNWIWRGPPEPSTEFAESGVPQEKPNDDLDGSVPGAPKSPWLVKLKNSSRNSAKGASSGCLGCCRMVW